MALSSMLSANFVARRLTGDRNIRELLTPYCRRCFTAKKEKWGWSQDSDAALVAAEDWRVQMPATRFLLSMLKLPSTAVPAQLFNWWVSIIFEQDFKKIQIWNFLKNGGWRAYFFGRSRSHQLFFQFFRLEYLSCLLMMLISRYYQAVSKRLRSSSSQWRWVVMNSTKKNLLEDEKTPYGLNQDGKKLIGNRV